MMKKAGLLAVVLLIACLACSCGGGGKNRPAVPGKVLNNPEVKLNYYGNPMQVQLPDVPELRWDFFQEADKKELTCRYKLKVIFKENGKFNAIVQFLDLNKFPVTTSSVKFIGSKGESTTYENTLYIDPKISGRITKAQVLLTPLK
ncbi:MAG: hypothetical protein RDV48_18135 [Candidatus Eremiobacteraeota bacterium]|nr:hypothetical protein [Candidatus Eremiobacteraeota bacterium]